MTIEFRAILTRLTGLRFGPVSLDGHWSALQSVPLTVLDAAVTHALAAQSEFPTPHELLVYCDLVAPPAPSGESENRVTPLAQPVEFTIPETFKKVRIDSEWKYDHAECGDSGMVSYWCDVPGGALPKPWYLRRDCGRKNEHAPHEFVMPCGCIPTNPTIQRRLSARAKYATAEPAERRRGA